MATLVEPALRALQPEEIAAYHRDGAAVVRGVLPMDWIERMRVAIDRILADPGAAAVEYTPEGKTGRYYGDFFLWLRDADFAAFHRDGPLPELAARFMGSAAVRFFYDQLLVKEPQTAEPTPWHQDLPYWPVRGSHILSVWVPFDRADRTSGVVTYVKGSHRWGKFYAPAAFGQKTGFADLYARMGLEPVPDIDAMAGDLDLTDWTVEPGDVIVHHPLTLHGAPGNASTTGRRRGLALRYLGDDAVWDAREGTFIDNPRVRALLPAITLADGDPVTGTLFPAVWPR